MPNRPLTFIMRAKNKNKGARDWKEKEGRSRSDQRPKHQALWLPGVPPIPSKRLLIPTASARPVLLVLEWALGPLCGPELVYIPVRNMNYEAIFHGP